MVRFSDLKYRRVPILFFANKMDCTDALSSVKIAAGKFFKLEFIYFDTIKYFLII